jgi:hypothetical protein
LSLKDDVTQDNLDDTGGIPLLTVSGYTVLEKNIPVYSSKYKYNSNTPVDLADLCVDATSYVSTMPVLTGFNYDNNALNFLSLQDANNGISYSDYCVSSFYKDGQTPLLLLKECSPLIHPGVTGFNHEFEEPSESMMTVVRLSKIDDVLTIREGRRAATSTDLDPKLICEGEVTLKTVASYPSVGRIIVKLCGGGGGSGASTADRHSPGGGGAGSLVGLLALRDRTPVTILVGGPGTWGVASGGKGTKGACSAIINGGYAFICEGGGGSDVEQDKVNGEVVRSVGVGGKCYTRLGSPDDPDSSVTLEEIPNIIPNRNQTKNYKLGSLEFSITHAAQGGNGGDPYAATEAGKNGGTPTGGSQGLFYFNGRPSEYYYIYAAANGGISNTPGGGGGASLLGDGGTSVNNKSMIDDDGRGPGGGGSGRESYNGFAYDNGRYGFEGGPGRVQIIY